MSSSDCEFAMTFLSTLKVNTPLWRFYLDRDSLWHAVIKSTYGMQEKGWYSNIVIHGSSRCPWKDTSQVSNSFSSCCQLVVGNEERVKF